MQQHARRIERIGKIAFDRHRFTLDAGRDQFRRERGKGQTARAERASRIQARPSRQVAKVGAAQARSSQRACFVRDRPGVRQRSRAMQRTPQ